MPRQGCGGSLPALSVGMDVSCCGLFLLVESPWDPVWSSANREKLNPKVREGRGRGCRETGEHGVAPAPTGHNPTAECGVWEEESPAGSGAGAGMRRLYQ